MSALKEDKSAVQTPNSVSSSSGLDIPEAMDGFFGYSEEKSLKQVWDRYDSKPLALNCLTQIEEKYWAHRRGSEEHSEAGSLKASLLPPSVSGSAISDAFHEEQTVADQLNGMAHVTGAYNLRSYCRILNNLCSLFHRTCYRHRASPTSSITSTMPRTT